MVKIRSLWYRKRYTINPCTIYGIAIIICLSFERSF
jgi:hypothetical protein